MTKLNNLHVLFSDLLTLLFLIIIKESVVVSNRPINNILLFMAAIIVLKIILLIVVEGCYLYDMRLKISYDALTKVYNRGSLDKMLPDMFVKAKTANKQLCVIMADIDHFKKVNDKYGHGAGDLVLKSFACLIKSNIRMEMGDVFRYGGEEFVICLWDTNLEQGLIIAERIRKLINEACFKYGDYNISITSSFGVAQAVNGIEGYEELLKLADSGLYEAKNTGRNKCVAMQGGGRGQKQGFRQQ